MKRVDTADILQTHAHDSKPETRGFWSFLGFKSTSLRHLSNAETRLLSCIKTKYSRKFVDVNNGKHRMWTLSVDNEKFKDNTPLVLVHGMGGGVGLWAQNIDSLSKTRTLHAFDVLGFGQSSRPNLEGESEAIENTLVDSIESWRQQMKIDKMVLLGHSFGGYLSAAYSLRYPDRVKHLILADPWGMQPRPQDGDERDNKRVRRLPVYLRPVLWFARRVAPLGIVRFAGARATGLIEWMRPDLGVKFGDGIYDYIYHSNAQHPTGELAFKSLNIGLGWAKRPMEPRLIESLPCELPVTFIYGDKSWMEKETGEKIKSACPNNNICVETIAESGHHVYADTPPEFNDLVNTICSQVDGTVTE